MMRRGLLLLIGSGLLSVLSGCQLCQGRCDCLVYPLDHGTPAPFVKPAPQAMPLAQPIAPMPVH
jgi:hypothetical protein